MQDPALDRHLAETKELKELWSLFHEYFKLGLKGEGMSRENDAKFLEVKSRVAMLHDAYMDVLRGQDARQTGQNMMKLVGRSITLRHINRMSDVDIKKVNLEWHECFLLLNETQGALEDKVAKLAPINPTVYKLKKLKARSLANAKGFFSGTLFKAFAVLAVAAIIIGGFMALGLGEHMKKIGVLRPIYFQGVGFYRTFIDKAFPYDNIDEFLGGTRSLSGGWQELGESPVPRQTVEAKFSNNIRTKLSGAPHHWSKKYFYQSSGGGLGGHMELHLFLFPSTADAISVGQQYTEMKAGASNPGEIAAVERERKMRRVVNVIIVYLGGNDSMIKLMDDGKFHGAQIL
jgi:hypothetical protein